MTTGVRLAAFAAALGVTLGVAVLVGSGLAPLRDGSTEGGHGRGADDAHGGDGQAPAAVSAPAPGLAVAEGGLRLVADATTRTPGDGSPWRFRVVDAEGAVVRDFDVEHERRMHLIVVRRDLTGYRHLHPRHDPDGSWSVPLRLPAGGVYRAYADFARGGRGHTLAVDLMAPGAFDPVPLPAPSASSGATIDVGAGRRPATGEEARLTTGTLMGGREARLDYSVTRDGSPAEDIVPYLGADGHLVALREGDLAFLHVHPETSVVPGRIGFRAELPSAGRYRLFLQYERDGAVRTVAHTIEVPR